jgi:hypothetical protein
MAAMKNPTEFEDDLADASPEEIMAAMFANMVIQQANMAYVFLGKAPNPETGQVTRDLETAKYFIDQLEMLAVKTRGNLDRQEEALLSQSLTTLRLAFVEATGGRPAIIPPPRPAGPAAPPAPPSEPAKPVPPVASAPAPASDTPSTPAPTPAQGPTPPEESRKRFSKKYQ